MMSSSGSDPGSLTWATIDPTKLGGKGGDDLYSVKNICDGKWVSSSKQTIGIIHPLDREAHPIFAIPDTQVEDLEPFYRSLRKVPKSGLHNPLKNPHRYLEYGEISRKVCSTYLSIGLFSVALLFL